MDKDQEKESGDEVLLNKRPSRTSTRKEFVDSGSSSSSYTNIHTQLLSCLPKNTLSKDKRILFQKLHTALSAKGEFDNDELAMCYRQLKQLGSDNEDECVVQLLQQLYPQASDMFKEIDAKEVAPLTNGFHHNSESSKMSLVNGTSHKRESRHTSKESRYSKENRRSTDSTKLKRLTLAKTELTEYQLIRDLLYVFQGVDGRYLHYDSAQNCYAFIEKFQMSAHIRTQSLKLCELGVLYHYIRNFCDSHSSDIHLGQVLHGMVAALNDELREYQRLLAVLDAQFRLDSEAETPLREEHVAALTLVRLHAWARQPLTRLKTLVVLASQVEGLRGGALASRIHTLAKHGDPMRRQCTLSVLSRTAVPLLYLLRKWLQSGEIDDIHAEFFVADQADVDLDRLWHDKFTLRSAMLPSFITEELATMIISTGKSLRFLREVCGEDEALKHMSYEWQKTLNESSVIAFLHLDFIPEGSELADAIRDAFHKTSAYVMDVMKNKFHLMDHMHAIRKYLLLGQGDFIRHLLDVLQPELSKTADQLFPHILTSLLDSTVRITTAQYDKEHVLMRLDTRVLSSTSSELGWDVFTLLYKVDGPIATVFTPETMTQYLMLFNTLWRVKRLEWVLSGVWKRQAMLTKMTRKIPEMDSIVHICEVTTARKVHVVQQTQYYLGFEVMACSWETLSKEANQSTSLDAFIAAHSQYLDELIKRALLNPEREQLLTYLRTLFDLIDAFEKHVVDLENVCTEELLRRNELDRIKIELEKKGEFSTGEYDEELEVQARLDFRRILDSSRWKIQNSGKSFQTAVEALLRKLNVCSDESLQCLAYRLDFNSYFHIKD